MYSDQRTYAIRQFYSGAQNSVLKHGVFKNVVPHKLYSFFCQILPTCCKQRQINLMWSATIRSIQASVDQYSKPEALCVMPKGLMTFDVFTSLGSKLERGKSLISGLVRSWVFFPGGLVVRLARHSVVHLLCIVLYFEYFVCLTVSIRLQEYERTIVEGKTKVFEVIFLRKAT